MTKMIIGLDIDDVIFDTSGYIERVLEDIGSVELDRIKVAIMRGDTNEPKVKEFLMKYLPLAIENAEMKEGASETIRKLWEAGNKIILITARGDQHFPGTEEKNEKALARNGISYDKIVYGCNSKVEACKINQVDVFVDDSPRNCEEVARELGIPVIGFESQITADALHQKKIFCVKNWVELENALDNIAK